MRRYVTPLINLSIVLAILAGLIFGAGECVGCLKKGAEQREKFLQKEEMARRVEEQTEERCLRKCIEKEENAYAHKACMYRCSKLPRWNPLPEENPCRQRRCRR
jgi:hypothetical protein